MRSGEAVERRNRRHACGKNRVTTRPSLPPRTGAAPVSRQWTRSALARACKNDRIRADPRLSRTGPCPPRTDTTRDAMAQTGARNKEVREVKDTSRDGNPFDGESAPRHVHARLHPRRPRLLDVIPNARLTRTLSLTNQAGLRQATSARARPAPPQVPPRRLLVPAPRAPASRPPTSPPPPDARHHRGCCTTRKLSPWHHVGGWPLSMRGGLVPGRWPLASARGGRGTPVTVWAPAASVWATSGDASRRRTTSPTRHAMARRRRQ